MHFPVELSEGRAEDIPLDDRAVDHVVMTWTLCSVADPTQALAEVRRVLRPGGSLLFIEHGRAPEPGLQRWQDRLTPLWRRLAGGCHLNRPIDRLIEASGLRLAELETGYLVQGPRVATYHYRGRARTLSHALASSAVIVLPSVGHNAMAACMARCEQQAHPAEAKRMKTLDQKYAPIVIRTAMTSAPTAPSNRPLLELAKTRMSRRTALKGFVTTAAMGALGGTLTSRLALAAEAAPRRSASRGSSR